MAEHPLYGRYVRGRLALAGIDLSLPLDIWLDAVYAVWADTPFELLDKLAAQMVRQAAQVRPEEARENWGRTPEQRALARIRGATMEAGGRAGAVPGVGPVPPRR